MVDGLNVIVTTGLQNVVPSGDRQKIHSVTGISEKKRYAITSASESILPI